MKWLNMFADGGSALEETENGLELESLTELVSGAMQELEAKLPGENLQQLISMLQDPLQSETIKLAVAESPELGEAISAIVQAISAKNKRGGRIQSKPPIKKSRFQNGNKVVKSTHGCKCGLKRIGGRLVNVNVCSDSPIRFDVGGKIPKAFGGFKLGIKANDYEKANGIADYNFDKNALNFWWKYKNEGLFKLTNGLYANFKKDGVDLYRLNGYVENYDYNGNLKSYRPYTKDELTEAKEIWYSDIYKHYKNPYHDFRVFGHYVIDPDDNKKLKWIPGIDADPNTGTLKYVKEINPDTGKEEIVYYTKNGYRANPKIAGEQLKHYEPLDWYYYDDDGNLQYAIAEEENVLNPFFIPWKQDEDDGQYYIDTNTPANVPMTMVDAIEYLDPKYLQYFKNSQLLPNYSTDMLGNGLGGIFPKLVHNINVGRVLDNEGGDLDDRGTSRPAYYIFDDGTVLDHTTPDGANKGIFNIYYDAPEGFLTSFADNPEIKALLSKTPGKIVSVKGSTDKAWQSPNGDIYFKNGRVRRANGKMENYDESTFFPGFAGTKETLQSIGYTAFKPEAEAPAAVSDSASVTTPTDSVPIIKTDSVPAVAKPETAVSDSSAVVTTKPEAVAKDSSAVVTTKPEAVAKESENQDKKEEEKEEKPKDLVEKQTKGKKDMTEEEKLAADAKAQNMTSDQLKTWREGWKAGGTSKFGGYTYDKGVELQKRLKAAGYYKGPIDGKVGKLTRAAMLAEKAALDKAKTTATQTAGSTTATAGSGATGSTTATAGNASAGAGAAGASSNTSATVGAGSASAGSNAAGGGAAGSAGAGATTVKPAASVAGAGSGAGAAVVAGNARPVVAASTVSPQSTFTYRPSTPDPKYNYEGLVYNLNGDIDWDKSDDVNTIINTQIKANKKAGLETRRQLRAVPISQRTDEWHHKMYDAYASQFEANRALRREKRDKLNASRGEYVALRIPYAKFNRKGGILNYASAFKKVNY